MHIKEINSKKNFAFTAIYKWTNLINHKIYIGQTRNFYNRMMAYRNGAFNRHMKHAVNKYGIDNFDVTILEKDLPI